MDLAVSGVVPQFSGARNAPLHSKMFHLSPAAELKMPWERKWPGGDRAASLALLFMAARGLVWIFSPLFLGDYHYKVIAVTKSPFHFQKGTEINNTC